MSLISQSKKTSLGFVIFFSGVIVLLMLVGFCNDVHLSFSIESGYYDGVLELEIRGGAGNRIFYTLDGSEPGTEDFLYHTGSTIILTDATSNKNVYSARTDTSTAFWTDMVDTYSGGNPGYTVPVYKVDKCNVIRASVFDREGQCLDTITGTYFIGFQNKSGYDGIYTASIVTDPDNLFGYENGIYVTGEAFDRLKKEIGSSQWEEYPYAPYWWWWTSNYSYRGFDWERPANVTIFDENRKIMLSDFCGIRIQGGGSRGKLPKSLGCYAREIYGRNDEFQTDLFRINQYPHKFVFFSGGDDNVFKLKDYMANTMEQGLAFATMDFIPCAVFLNGEYWGIYYVTENYNSDYISDHYHVKEDNVIMDKSGELAEGTEEDADLFQEAMQYIAFNDMSLEENYKQACKLIDIESYIDYYAAQIYIARYNDWPATNIAVWRTRKNDGSHYGDCRWRWMLFDVNSGGLSADQTDADTLLDTLMDDRVFYSLYLNQEFRVRFAKRLLYIGREIFNEENCRIFLDNYSETMREPIAQSNLRFYNEEKRDLFDDNVKNTGLFFEKRYEVVWNFMVNNMGEAWLEENGIQK